jgi:quinol monooxygenase YgiN
MIAYVVRMRARPGRRDELLAALQELVDAATAGEPGTLVYAFHTVEGDPDSVLSYELFADDEALATHRDGPSVTRMLPVIGPLVADTEAWRGTPVTGKGLPAT